MARSYNFAVLRLCPDPARGEFVNLGLVVFREIDVDIRLGEVLTRAKILYPEMTSERLAEGIAVVRRFGATSLGIDERYRALRQIGPFTLGELGHFTVADDTVQNYEESVARILRLFTVAPRKIKTVERNRSKLTTQIKRIFRKEGILAQIGDAGAISEHKIVPEWPIPTRPSLRADLALQNRIMRVCEIVDMSLTEDGPPPASLFEGVVTLDVAQREANAQQTVFAYRAAGPMPRIDEALGIAKLHATKLVNWNLPIEREEFLHDWISAANDRPATHQVG